MDTKLKNYNEIDTKSGWVRPFLCMVAGLVFLAGSIKLIISACQVAHIYDLHYFFIVNGFKSEAAYHASEAYKQLDAELPVAWKLTAIFTVVALIGLVLCCMAVRRKVTWFDKIFTEIQLMAFIGSAVGAGACTIEFAYSYHSSEWMDNFLKTMDLSQKQVNALIEYKGWYWMQTEANSFDTMWVELLAFLGCIAGLLLVCLLIFLSWVKKLKARCFWRYTLVGCIYRNLTDAFRDAKGIQGKVMAILVIGALLSATWIGLIFVLAAIIYFVPKQMKKYKAIRDGVNLVKNGDVDHKIQTLEPGKKPGELDRLAESINEISAATSVAVANELKNQRMKTDLISNVSHDLKTPLTSMVTYVDLLKKEGLDSENAAQYLDIIEEKTGRLRKLTEDLFEAAKASSGAIQVNLERIEMASIIGQALAEVEERLDVSQLEVILSDRTKLASGEGAFVMADGQLLWRVMENLLVNASKYALPGSRVYLDLSQAQDEEGRDMILMEMKNMSKDQLNIDAEELMERFKRGDASRNTEGSGLGLAIAKDLIKLMEGQLNLTIDGDLFKVSVLLPRA